MQRVDVVVGAQYGSEGKGHVTAQLVLKALVEDPDQMQIINVRVAGPNAGHTVYDSNGVRFALRCVPVGAAISDDITLYIAPGSEIDLGVLHKEVQELRLAGHSLSKFSISGEATILEPWHKEQEATAHLTERIGSTGKGIGAARSARIYRYAARVKDSQIFLNTLDKLGISIAEPAELYANDRVAADEDTHVIIEGTQGYALGLHAGFYPQCTSSDCRAIDFLAMAGLSPWRLEMQDFKVWVVARVYPIRVAGNSGPMNGETSWEALGLEPEHTTVTHKVRRVGQWEPQAIFDAVQANGGMKHVVLALTMVDQKFPEFEGAEGKFRTVENGGGELAEFLAQAAHDAMAPLGMITTSPTTAVWF